VFIFPLSIQALNVDDCRIMGDADAIGLGIRAGVYLLHSSNIITSFTTRAEEAVNSLTFSNIILAGIQVAVFTSASRNNLPQGVVIAILMVLLLDIIMTTFLVVFLAAIRRGGVELSVWTALLILMRCCGTIAYNLWFWYRGLDMKNEQQCMEPRVFVFTSLGANGDVRTWSKIFVTTLAIGALGVLIWVARDIWRRIIHFRRTFGRLPWTYKMPGGARWRMLSVT
jgi:hypothetical protein